MTLNQAIDYFHYQEEYAFASLDENKHRINMLTYIFFSGEFKPAIDEKGTLLGYLTKPQYKDVGDGLFCRLPDKAYGILDIEIPKMKISKEGFMSFFYPQRFYINSSSTIREFEEANIPLKKDWIEGLKEICLYYKHLIQSTKFFEQHIPADNIEAFYRDQLIILNRLLNQCEYQLSK